MSDERTREVTAKFRAESLSAGQEEDLEQYLAALKELAMSFPARTTWMGSFAQGINPADGEVEIKISTVPRPATGSNPTSLTDQSDSLAELTTALRELRPPDSGT